MATKILTKPTPVEDKEKSNKDDIMLIINTLPLNHFVDVEIDIKITTWRRAFYYWLGQFNKDAFSEDGNEKRFYRFAINQTEESKVWRITRIQ